MVFIVRCPKCGQDQKTAPNVKKVGDITKKVKRCVYCGHSFRIHGSLTKSRIVNVSKK